MRTPLRLLAVALALAPGPGDEAAPADALLRFRELLHELRRGDDAAAVELAEIADRLCRDHGRCDAREVAAFYARLSPADRERGLEDESRFLHLRQRLYEAGVYGLPAGESWPELRAELRTELEDLAQRVERDPDFTPAARAWALLATIDIEEVEQAGLSPSDETRLLERAEQRARRSLELFASAGQTTPRLEPSWIVGRIERARGEPGRARETFEDCLALAERVGNDAFRERALFGLVDLARDAGDVAAIDRALSRVASFRSPADSWPLAREHALRLVHSDRAESAIAFLLRYEPVEASYLDEWHALLAVSFLRSGDLQAARRELHAIEAQGDELGTLVHASLQLAAGLPQDVVDALEPAATGGAFSFRSRVEACSLLGEAWLALERPERAAPWLTEALERADAWQELQVEGSSGSVVGEWLGLHTVVLAATAATRLGQPLEAARLVEDYHGRRLRADDSATARVAVGADELRTWAGRFDQGLVTWAVGADASVVAHVAADGDAWSATIPLGRRAVEGAVRRLREAALAGESARLGDLAGEIAHTLLPPELRARLARGGRLLLLLHGPLENLPLALLELDGRPFDEVFEPLVLPGLPAGGRERTGERAPRWVLAGDAGPSATGRPALPGAARELAAVARRHPTALVLRGEDFTRAALLDALDQGTALHVAAHLVASDACADARMASVGIELAGGDVLCASEILARCPPLELVVLAACESAGGRPIDAEGLHGVARAFLEAGARDVLVTLWPVEDEAARRFGVTFHAALEAGLSPSAAARAGRLELRARGLPAADWASFRLMGDGRASTGL